MTSVAAAASAINTCVSTLPEPATHAASTACGKPDNTNVPASAKFCSRPASCSPNVAAPTGVHSASATA
eukprot:730-Chlamydomonas_euryale.AAC.11